MHPRTALYGAIVLLVGTVVTATAGAAPSQGFVEADSPVTLQGDLRSQITDPTFLFENPDLSTPAPPLVLRAQNVTVTHKVLEVTKTTADNPVDPVTLEHPSDGAQVETFTAQNATIEITGLGPGADVLLAPGTSGTLIGAVTGDDARIEAISNPEGVTVLDGYRKRSDGIDPGDPAFKYEYERDQPLVGLDGSPQLEIAGDATSYVWDAHVLIRNRTETLASYETGYRSTSSNMGATTEDHYEYVTLDLTAVEASLDPTGLEAQVLAPAIAADLVGTVGLEDPAGSIQGEEGLYDAGGRSKAVVDGNLSLGLTPGASASGDERLTLGIQGSVASTDLPLIEDNPLISTKEVVAGAGGATLVGLAAWYTVSAKGASLAVPLIGTARTREEDEEEASELPAPDQPGDLLFDPDRFTLYHLVRSRVGLSAAQCTELTGIEDAAGQLDTLAEHGLLEVLSDGPRRYCVPGSVEGRMAERIVFLRQPEALRLGELLAVHGLTPIERLKERARRTEGPLKPRRVPELVQEFVRVGLAYREQGEEGYVIDPTDELFACFERMGEGAIPKVS